VTPVKKFTDRKKAVARIWKAIQNLGEADAPQSAHVAPEEAPAKKKASRAKKAPTSATKAGAPREGSKTSQAAGWLMLSPVLMGSGSNCLAGPPERATLTSFPPVARNTGGGQRFHGVRSLSGLRIAHCTCVLA
jgi:hypothetical protein